LEPADDRAGHVAGGIFQEIKRSLRFTQARQTTSDVELDEWVVRRDDTCAQAPFPCTRSVAQVDQQPGPKGKRKPAIWVALHFPVEALKGPARRFLRFFSAAEPVVYLGDETQCVKIRLIQLGRLLELLDGLFTTIEQIEGSAKSMFDFE